MALKSTPVLNVCLPCVSETVSPNCSRCSSGKAGLGRAFCKPYAMTLVIVTIGPVPFAVYVSRSRDHWKWKALITVGLMIESQFATKLRSWNVAFPLEDIDSLFCVGLVR